MFSREDALALLKKYNREPYHIRHALTVEAMMDWYAGQEGYAAEAEYWSLVGLLHDVDFERYPEEHCLKAPELLREIGADDRFIRSVLSHASGTREGLPEPEHPMEKILFAADELTGLIWAAALMRPSRSVSDMELKSLKKKFKDKSFAAGCSRDVIARGAGLLGWELDTLLGKTLQAMKDTEARVEEQAALA